MAFADKKGIVVASPFRLQAESMLDLRQQVDTLIERDELVTIKAATAGLRVFVKETKQSYVYNGTEWEPLSTNSGTLIVTLNGGTSEDTNKFTFNGTGDKTVNITPSSIGASQAVHSHTKSQITDFPESLKNPFPITFEGAVEETYDGSSSVTINIPESSYTDNSLIVTLNGGTTEGTDKFTFNGSTEKTINITPTGIGAATEDHSHNASDIYGLPTSLKNPFPITFEGAVEETYDGSSSVTINIPTAGSTDASLIIQLNGGTTEDTDKFTFNGSTEKTINITPTGIGAAASNHTHSYAGSDTVGGPARQIKVPTVSKSASYDPGTRTGELAEFMPGSTYDLPTNDYYTILTTNGFYTSRGVQLALGSDVDKIAYRNKKNGSWGEWDDILTSNNYTDYITPTGIGAAASTHTHSYAGSSSPGGAATSANKVNVPVGTVMFSVESTTTFFNSCFGGTWRIVGHLDYYSHGSSASITLYIFKKIAI